MFAGWWLVTQGALKSRASILAFDMHLACFRFPLRTGGGSLTSPWGIHLGDLLSH